MSRIDANETRIEHAGVNLLSYIAPGDEHTALTDGTFYTETVNGETLVDWVTWLIERKPVDDVHCRRCRAGAHLADRLRSARTLPVDADGLRRH